VGNVRYLKFQSMHSIWLEEWRVCWIDMVLNSLLVYLIHPKKLHTNYIANLVVTTFKVAQTWLW